MRLNGRVKKLESKAGSRLGDATIVVIKAFSKNAPTCSDSIAVVTILGQLPCPVFRRRDYEGDSQFWRDVNETHMRIHGRPIERTGLMYQTHQGLSHD